MSETIAICITTVSLVSDAPRYRVLGSIALALAVADAGGRLLTPRARPIEAAEVDLRSYFSAEEIERGARFARPQLALGLARSALELGALALVSGRPPRLLRRRCQRPVAGGVAAGGALALALTLSSLPLSVIARRRANRRGARHPILACLGRRPGQGERDPGRIRRRGRGRGARGDAALPAPVVGTDGRGL